MSDGRVEPPAEHRAVRWHWLMTKSGTPTIGMWMKGMWLLAGEQPEQSAEWLARRGWRYYAPCLPPEAGDA